MKLNDSAIKSRIIKGLASKGVAQLVTIFIQFASIPIFVTQWGADKYGVWLLLSTLPAYLTLCNLGFATVVTNKMTMANAKGEQKSANAFFQSGWFAISIFSFCIYGLVHILVYALPMVELLTNEFISLESLQLTLVLLSAYTLVCFQGGFISAGYCCNGNFSLSVMSDSAIRLIENLMLFYVVFQYNKIEYAAAALLISRTILLLLNALFMLSVTKWLHYGFRFADKSIIKTLVKPSFAFMLIPLTNALNIQGITLMIGYVMGPTFVAIFNTARTLSRLGIQLVSTANQVLMPELSALLAKNDTQRATRLLIKSGGITLLGAIAFTAFLSALGPAIVSFWTDSKINSSNLLMFLLASSTVLHALWHHLSISIIAVNKHSAFSFQFLIISLFSVCVSYIAIYFLGLYGAALSILLTNILTIFVIYPPALRMLSLTPKTYSLAVMSFYQRRA